MMQKKFIGAVEFFFFLLFHNFYLAVTQSLYVYVINILWISIFSNNNNWAKQIENRFVYLTC